VRTQRGKFKKRTSPEEPTGTNKNPGRISPRGERKSEKVSKKKKENLQEDLPEAIGSEFGKEEGGPKNQRKKSFPGNQEENGRKTKRGGPAPREKAKKVMWGSSERKWHRGGIYRGGCRGKTCKEPRKKEEGGGKLGGTPADAKFAS